MSHTAGRVKACYSCSNSGQLATAPTFARQQQGHAPDVARRFPQESFRRHANQPDSRYGSSRSDDTWRCGSLR
jgi:hypothetical protein